MISSCLECLLIAYVLLFFIYLFICFTTFVYPDKHIKYHTLKSKITHYEKYNKAQRNHRRKTNIIMEQPKYYTWYFRFLHIYTYEALKQYSETLNIKINIKQNSSAVKNHPHNIQFLHTCE